MQMPRPTGPAISDVDRHRADVFLGSEQHSAGHGGRQWAAIFLHEQAAAKGQPAKGTREGRNFFQAQKQKGHSMTE